jgi:Arc/MetJ-type ribon-helix-helix transcriptional regulator
LALKQIRKTITIPEELVEWAERKINNGKYPGVRSFSGLIEYLLRKEKDQEMGG